MDLKKEAAQRKEFSDILLELSKSQNQLQDAYYRSSIYKRLEALYDAPSEGDHFRHFYSDIFSVLTQVQQNSDLGDINILGQNLDIIRSGYQPQNKTDDGRLINVSNSINKLYDHVSLDIARISYSDAADRRIEQKENIAQVKSEINALQEKINDTRKGLTDTIDRTVRDAQKDYIAILGIFAAVVLAFTGGIAFSTSVLENMHSVSAYRAIIISLIIGLVIYNVLFGLFHFIQRIVGTEGTEKGNNMLAIIVNMIFLLLIGLTILAWNKGWIEKRDQNVFYPYQTENVEEIYPATSVAPERIE